MYEYHLVILNLNSQDIKLILKNNKTIIKKELFLNH
jgi:hypothetical protein